MARTSPTTYDETLPVLVRNGAPLRNIVPCIACHGQVDQMPLTTKAQPLSMSQCLECHEHPEQYVRPREEVFNMAYQPPANQTELGRQLVAEYHIQTQISCSTCHR